MIVYLEIRELIYDLGATQSISEHRKNNKAFYSATLLNSFLSLIIIIIILVDSFGFSIRKIMSPVNKHFLFPFPICGPFI